MIRLALATVVLSAMSSPAQFQWPSGNVQEFRADIRGGGGDRGKCTLEVEVDEVAEVEVLGDIGRLRTISGSTATWRRFLCNAPMPLNPAEFRYRGIDGRGRQQLLQSPDGIRPAIIRIEDPRPGREGFTFDLEWRGASSTPAPTGRYTWGSSGAPAASQVDWQSPSSVQEFRAQIRGGGGDRGKCTIEVEVDDVAEVEVLGEIGRIRTLSGSPSTWRRFVCNIPMPLNPAEFRYRGIDGRGRQQLAQAPGFNRPAVIRIEDPRGGREGYTFDLEWRGQAPGSPSGGSWGSAPSSSGGTWGGPPSGGWNTGSSGAAGNIVNYSARGNGFFRNSAGFHDELRGCRVLVQRNQDVEVVFNTRQSGEVVLRGRARQINPDSIIADVSGNGIAGSLQLFRNATDGVREIRMSGNQPVSFELQWTEDAFPSRDRLPRPADDPKRRAPGP